MQIDNMSKLRKQPDAQAELIQLVRHHLHTVLFCFKFKFTDCGIELRCSEMMTDVSASVQ